MTTYIVYEGGAGKQTIKTEIQATSVTSAKSEASKLFGVKGRWRRCTFNSKLDGVQRTAWTKGASGISYGDHYIHMYEA